jgi:hypothetical protein
MPAAREQVVRDGLCRCMAIHPTLELARADARVREPGMRVGDD